MLCQYIFRKNFNQFQFFCKIFAKRMQILPSPCTTVTFYAILFNDETTVDAHAPTVVISQEDIKAGCKSAHRCPR